MEQRAMYNGKEVIIQWESEDYGFFVIGNKKATCKKTKHGSFFVVSVTIINVEVKKEPDENKWIQYKKTPTNERESIIGRVAALLLKSNGVATYEQVQDQVWKIYRIHVSDKEVRDFLS